MTADLKPVRLDQVTARFTTSGRCQRCNKRIKRTKSYTGRTLRAVVDQSVDDTDKRPLYCKKHKPNSATHTVMFDRSEDEMLTVILDGEELVSANHDEHGWAGVGLLEQSFRKIAEKMKWEIVDG